MLSQIETVDGSTNVPVMAADRREKKSVVDCYLVVTACYNRITTRLGKKRGTYLL